MCAQSVSTWDGTEATSFASGNGSQASPYIIENAAQLAYFGKNMNGKTWYVELAVDINLDNREWVYGKNSATNFKGHFNGKHNGVVHTISSLVVVPVSAKNNGFFSSLQGSASSRAEVKNLIIDGVTISQSGDLAANTTSGTLAGSVTEYTDIENVTVKNISISFVNLTGTNYIGGLAGRIQRNNCQITNCSIENPSIHIAGATSGGASYIGGVIGQMVGSSGLPSSINGMTVTSPSVTVNKNSVANSCFGAALGNINTYSAVASVTVSDPILTYKATDNPNYAVNLGSFAGYIVGNATQEVSVTDIDITGDAQVVLGTSSSNLSNIRAGLVGYANTNVRLEDWTVENTEVQVKGNLTTAINYLAGLVGYSYTNATNTPVTIKDVLVADCDIVLGGNISFTTYVGGIVGMLKAYATTPENANSIEQCSVSGKIRSTGSHTFAENITYAFGGIVGYTDQNATNISEIKQCTSNVDFNLSGFTPVKVSGSNYNLYRNAFIVGGVVGRLNNPSRLPEHVFYSGKIYAPFAAVAPIVGVFYIGNNSAVYPYNEYSGESSTNVTAEEWQKTESWYYNGYKLGLSSDVINQTARTKNYKTSPVADGGVSYLTVDDKTFDRPNEISGAARNSYTVLAYKTNNSNVDMGIYPQWNTNTATYPAYYMYYMQGLNRGTYVPNDEVNFVKALMASSITFNPTLRRTGDDEHGYVFTVNPGRVETIGEYTLTYRWYQSDKTTPIAGETGKILSMTKDELEAAGNTVYCVVTVSGTGFTSVSRTLQGRYTIVVFVNGKNYTKNGAQPGNDTNDGMTPQTPVKTIDKANSLLDGGPWDKNIIVVMGELASGTGDANAFKSRGTSPATLTGKWDGVDYEGVINLVNGGEQKANPGDGPGKDGLHNYVSADTKFENLVFRVAGSPNNCFFDCHGHDVWFGKGLRMQGFINLSDNHGNLAEDTQTIPEFSVLLTASNIAHPEDAYWVRSKPQTLTIESGHYGRILGGRFIANFFENSNNKDAFSGNTSHSILATAQHPAWAVINIDIDNDNDMKSADGSKTYTCDVNCIIAGLTDGTMFGDYEINVRGGNVRYIVGANQGNGVRSGNNTLTPQGGRNGTFGQWPNSSFYGRVVINVDQKEDSKPITINNLYAGGLGRKADKTDAVVDMYLYGRTEINVKSGTIVGNVYGGGAGGVLGRNPWDPRAPYATTAADDASNAIINGVQYGGMSASSPLANVTLHNPDGHGNYTTEVLNLASSSTTLNISGGTIRGSVYGGGDGYVSNLPSNITMQGVGSIFGTSTINITGGTIMGSVYGGSKGSEKYYGMINVYGQTITHIAEMNGDVNLNISGTAEKWPTIGGNIYGGGKGVASVGGNEYTNIATTGNEDYPSNITITFDMPEGHPFEGNIYGGGEMGTVNGNTNVIILNGEINGSVFGGGKGEEGHPDKAKVTGSTNVQIGEE